MHVSECLVCALQGSGDAERYMAMAKDTIEQLKSCAIDLRQMGQPNDNVVQTWGRLLPLFLLLLINNIHTSLAKCPVSLPSPTVWRCVRTSWGASTWPSQAPCKGGGAPEGVAEAGRSLDGASKTLWVGSHSKRCAHMHANTHATLTLQSKRTPRCRRFMQSDSPDFCSQ